MRILIVDDEERIRTLLRISLERAGHEVYEAENGRKGVLLRRTVAIDLLVCDLIMPVQDGIETIAQFRGEFPDTGIIAISGGGKIGPDSYLRVAQQLGAWRVFVKPVDMVELHAAINEWQTLYLR
jgi:DNA-binding response OmpR family regulator